MKPDKLSYQLAEFALKTRSTGRAYGAAKKAFLDFLACCAAALREADTARAINVARRIFPAGKCLIPFLGQGFNSAGAAWLGAFLGHYVDFDDISWTMLGHPTTVVLPAAWAVATEENASGKDFLDAFIVGTEIATKLGSLVNPSHFDAGWHATATLGIFGSTGACVRLRGMSLTEAANSFGIAASMACGLKGQFGSSGKAIQVANAAKGGVFAAECGRQGMTSLQAMFGSQGYFQLVSSERMEKPKPEFYGGLGHPFELVSPGLMHKLFPCCGRLSTTIKQVNSVFRDNRISWQNVRKVVCRVDDATRRVLPFDLPTVPLEGKFSLPWAVAIAAIEGAPLVEHFSKNALKTPSIRSFAKKVKVEVVDDLPPGKLILVVEYAREVRQFTYPTEDHDKVTREQIENKLKSVVGKRWHQKKLVSVVRTVNQLEREVKLGRLSQMIGQ